jgi:hypothetical protein
MTYLPSAKRIIFVVFKITPVSVFYYRIVPSVQSLVVKSQIKIQTKGNQDFSIMKFCNGRVCSLTHGLTHDSTQNNWGNLQSGVDGEKLGDNVGAEKSQILIVRSNGIKELLRSSLAEILSGGHSTGKEGSGDLSDHLQLLGSAVPGRAGNTGNLASDSSSDFGNKTPSVNGGSSGSIPDINGSSRNSIPDISGGSGNSIPDVIEQTTISMVLQKIKLSF